MTREVKLSLILGFAVVLSVMLLLSDHFSGAQQARQTGINPERGIDPVTAYAPAPEPTLILVDEQGRPQQPQPRPTQPTPQPGNPRQKAIMPTAIADANSPQPVVQDDTTLLDRLQARFTAEVGNAVNDLASGQTPPPAVATNEPIRFDEPMPVDPSAGIPIAGAGDEPVEQIDSTVPEVEVKPAPPAELATYEVKEGDTLWSIAARQLGNGSRHAEIAALNRDRMGKGNTLRVGSSLRMPGGVAGDRDSANSADERRVEKPAKREVAESAQAVKKKNGKTVYVVKSGDTLGGIAAKYLGSSAKYDDLLLANAGTLKDEDSLEVGMELMIPGR